MSDEKTAEQRLATNEATAKERETERKNVCVCVSSGERGWRVSLKFKCAAICVCIVCTQFLIYFIFFSSPSSHNQQSPFEFAKLISMILVHSCASRILNLILSHSRVLSQDAVCNVYKVVIHKLDANKNPFEYYLCCCCCCFLSLPIFQ